MSKPAYPSIVEARKHAEAQEGNLRQAIKMGLAMKRELEEKKASQPAPDATGKCGELETVEHQYWRDQTQEWLPTGFPDRYRKDGFSVRELVTRSQAEELLAAERAEKEAWKNASIELDKAQEAIEADHAAKVEQERLRFEGDLDKWMKIIGAGITGYQPEAYALMDLACEELVTLRADNAALTARVTELGRCHEGTIDLCNQKTAQIEALEAKLTAAEKSKDAMRKAAVDYCWQRYKSREPMNLKDPAVFTSHEWEKIGEAMDEAARAALGGKPS